MLYVAVDDDVEQEAHRNLRSKEQVDVADEELQRVGEAYHQQGCGARWHDVEQLLSPCIAHAAAYGDNAHDVNDNTGEYHT